MAVLSLFTLSLAFCFLVVTTSMSQANTTQNYHYYCDFNQARGNYTANSTYSRNLNTLLSTLTSNTEIDYGFYNFTFGENTDQVYAIGLCRGDVNKEKCRSCLEYSRVQLTQFCPNQKEAIGWYDNEKCMLRYSDRSIFGLNEIRPGYYLWYTNNTLNSTQQEQFDRVVMDLLYSLRSKASSGDSRVKYATESATGPDNKKIYGLMQCTPDLSETDCHDCLLESVRELPTCCSKTIGPTYVRASCILRYETSTLFYGPPAYALPSRPPPPAPPGESNRTAVAISIAVPLAVVAVVFIFIFIFLRVRKLGKKLKKPNDDDDEIDISESLQFNFNTIKEATNDFSDSNKLGQGGFGTVYKGRLSNGQEIAVKRLSTNSRQGDREFKNEVVLVAKLQHRNLVRLLGFCLEGRERLLVYEFVPNKSLDYFIFDQTKRAQLDWEKRYKIIEGIARGILYLHRDSRLRIIHRDLKASNILLDEEMNPKISDFGLARIFVMNQTHGDTNRIVGTYGYMAPEYAMHGQFSEKSDVFSFGVLILEIVSGQKNSGISHGEHIEDLLNFVWRNWKEGTTTNIVDPTLNKVSENEIIRCIHIGLLCVQENVAARPTMASVILVLNSDSAILPVPLEPAFYVDDRTGNLPDKQLWEFNSGTRSSERITSLDQESINEVSITDPYPR